MMSNTIKLAGRKFLLVTRPARDYSKEILQINVIDEKTTAFITSSHSSNNKIDNLAVHG